MAFPLCGGNVRRQGEPALPTNTPEEPFFEAVPSTDIPCIVLRNAVFRLPRGEHSLKSVELYEEFLVGALLGAKTILEKNRNLPGNTLPNLKP